MQLKELFDSIALQNAENRTVSKSLPLFLKYFVKCLFLKRLCQTVENLKYDYNQNTGRLSFWEQEIQEIIHVHPKGTNTTKFSDGDIDFMTAHPNVTFSIIVNSVVYEIWGRTYLPTETVAH